MCRMWVHVCVCVQYVGTCGCMVNVGSPPPLSTLLFQSSSLWAISPAFRTNFLIVPGEATSLVSLYICNQVSLDSIVFQDQNNEHIEEEALRILRKT